MDRFRLGVVILLGALALVGCSRRRFDMPAGSMIPTIAVGAKITADTSKKTPARGDVFVFHYPEHVAQDFVKRIVGLPGDRIETKGRVLSVNGAEVPSCVVGPYAFNDADGKHSGTLLLESGGTAYLVFHEDVTSFAGSGPWTVAPGEYFAIGDNRNNSHDSRSWFGGKGGGVPTALLVGRVELPPLGLPPGAESLAPDLARCKAVLHVP